MARTAEQRERYREAHRRKKEARRAWLSAYKLESGCTDCGYAEHPAALEFDHVRGNKVKAVSKMTSWEWSKILDEIGKCEVVCANCHAVRTALRRV